MSSNVVGEISSAMNLYLWNATGAVFKEMVLDNLTTPVRANVPRVSIWTFDD